MPQPSDSRPPRAAGSLLALAIIAGAFIGAFVGQSSAGLVIGTGIGAVVAVAFWLIDQRRAN